MSGQGVDKDGRATGAGGSRDPGDVCRGLCCFVADADGLRFGAYSDVANVNVTCARGEAAARRGADRDVEIPADEAIKRYVAEGGVAGASRVGGDRAVAEGGVELA